MIKVSFRSVNATDDVCRILEDALTNQTEIEKWLTDQIQTIEFDCMDFPHDLEAFYDCYFSSSHEVRDAYHIFCLLKQGLANVKQVHFSVSIVDDQLKHIREIMLCPYCEQGDIRKVMVKRSKEIIYICDECDTVWNSHESISNSTGIGFGLYADQRGFKPLWTELEIR